MTHIQFSRPDPHVVIWPCSILIPARQFDSVFCDVWTFFSCFWKFAAAKLSCCRGSLPFAQNTFKSFEEKSFYWTSSDVFIKRPEFISDALFGKQMLYWSCDLWLTERSARLAVTSGGWNFDSNAINSTGKDVKWNSGQKAKYEKTWREKKSVGGAVCSLSARWDGSGAGTTSQEQTGSKGQVDKAAFRRLNSAIDHKGLELWLCKLWQIDSNAFLPSARLWN